MDVHYLKNYLSVDPNFVPLNNDDVEFLIDLGVNESQRWIEAVTRKKFDSPDFLESLADGELLCELLEQIWPCYLALTRSQLQQPASQEDAVSNTSTRLLGQRDLTTFRRFAEAVGIPSDYIFPERFLIAFHSENRPFDSPDLLQELLIRVVVTIYLLGCRCKETPTYSGPQLDLTAFAQLFQHYLRNFHKKDGSLCNAAHQSSEKLNLLPDSDQGGHSDVSEASTDGPLVAHSDQVDRVCPAEDMPGHVYDDDGPSYFGKGVPVYRDMYADSTGSSNDSAFGTSSPSSDSQGARHHMDHHLSSDEFVKAKGPVKVAGNEEPMMARREYIQVEEEKHKMKEDELEWQMNLNEWKQKRKYQLPEHENSTDLDSEKVASDSVTTFPAMIAARLKEGKGVPSFLESLYEEQSQYSVEIDRKTDTSQADSVIQPSTEEADRDSSSGISSPRSSRSFMSNSPTPLCYAPKSTSVTGAIRNDKHVQLQPVSRKVSSPQREPAAHSPTIVENANSKNPNIETSCGSFRDKLALFRKVDTEEEVVHVDLEKCNYKELAKPQKSLKEKLSLFESAMKSQTEPMPVVTEKPVGGISRLLSKDLGIVKDQSRIEPVSKPENATDSKQERLSMGTSRSPERFLREIEGILGPNSPVTSAEILVEVSDDFPPPPLPSSPPPPIFTEKKEDPEVEYFPPPPSEPVTPMAMEPTTSNDSFPEQRKVSFSKGSSSEEDEEVQLRRMGSTKRIKTELLKRRSDFFGVAIDDKDDEMDTVQKPRPISLQELIAPISVNEQLRNQSDRKELSPQLAEDPVTSLMPTKENAPVRYSPKEEVIAQIVEEYHKEIEREKPKVSQSELPVEVPKPVQSPKEPVGILKKRVESNREEVVRANVPVNQNMVGDREVAPAYVPKAALSETTVKRQVTEERFIKNTYERAEFREQFVVSERTVRSTSLSDMESNINRSIKDPQHIPFPSLASRHQRDLSLDGGYSSGRSDPGHNLPSPPEISVPKRTEPLPQRPPFPTEFSGYHRPNESPTSSAHPESNSYNSLPLNKNRASSYDAQNHWVVQEAEMRRIAESQGERNVPRSISMQPISTRPLQEQPPQPQFREPVSDQGMPRTMSMQPSSSRPLQGTSPQPRFIEAINDHSMPRSISMQHAVVPRPMQQPSPQLSFVEPTNGHHTVPRSTSMQPSVSRRPNDPLPQPIPSHQRIPQPSYQTTHDTKSYRFEEQRFPDIRTSHNLNPVSQDPYNTPSSISKYSREMPQKSYSYTAPLMPSARVPEPMPQLHHPARDPYPTVHNANVSGVHQRHRSEEQRVYQPDQSIMSVRGSARSSFDSLSSSAMATTKEFSRPGFSQPRHMEPSVPGFNATPASTKKRCAHCNLELGAGAAMVVEHLQLYYHVACFKCCVCGQVLGNGSRGADVHVRNAKLHCSSCSSCDEKGVQESLL